MVKEFTRTFGVQECVVTVGHHAGQFVAKPFTLDARGVKSAVLSGRGAPAEFAEIHEGPALCDAIGFLTDRFGTCAQSSRAFRNKTA